MPSQPRSRSGLLLCLTSAAGFGSLAVFGKQAYADGLDVAGVLVLRFGIAAPLLVGLALVARRRLRLPWPVAVRLLAMGAVGYAIQATLFFSALTRISAGLTGLLLYVYPALVTAGAVALGRHRLVPGRRRDPRPRRPGGGRAGRLRGSRRHGRGRHRPGDRHLLRRARQDRVDLGVDRLVVRAGVHGRARGGGARRPARAGEAAGRRGGGGRRGAAAADRRPG